MKLSTPMFTCLKCRKYQEKIRCGEKWCMKCMGIRDRFWVGPLTRNKKTGLVEWECAHGVWHPDPTSADETAERFGHDPEVWHDHGCDGCCRRKDFPGR